MVWGKRVANNRSNQREQQTTVHYTLLHHIMNMIGSTLARRFGSQWSVGTFVGCRRVYTTHVCRRRDDRRRFITRFQDGGSLRYLRRFLDPEGARCVYSYCV
jgi:hypothetical protein